jgi:hypothetical protein
LLREHKELKERLADLGELTVYKTVRCALLQEGRLTEADKAAVKEKIGTLYLNKKAILSSSRSWRTRASSGRPAEVSWLETIMWRQDDESSVQLFSILISPGHGITYSYNVGAMKRPELHRGYDEHG